MPCLYHRNQDQKPERIDWRSKSILNIKIMLEGELILLMCLFFRYPSKMIMKPQSDLETNSSQQVTD